MKCRVSVRLSVFEDPVFNCLRGALHPETVVRHLRALAAELPRKAARLELYLAPLTFIRVIRHEPGCRYVAEYGFSTDRSPGSDGEVCRMIGWVQADDTVVHQAALLSKLWRSGFGPDSCDGVTIPEPMGCVASLHLLLQRRVEGESLKALLGVPYSIQAAQRVAEAAAKLHRMHRGLETGKDPASSLGSLRDGFDRLLRGRPGLRTRLENVYQACCRMGSTLGPTEPRLTHGGLRPSQVILNGHSLHLLGFDRSCLGDPAMDIGGFLGHVTEQSIRRHGHAGAYSYFELILKERYLELAGVDLRPRIRIHQTLTVASLLAASAAAGDQAGHGEALLEWCEERLDLRSRKSWAGVAVPHSLPLQWVPPRFDRAAPLAPPPQPG